MESNYEKEMNKRNEKIPYEKEMNKRNEKIPDPQNCFGGAAINQYPQIVLGGGGGREGGTPTLISIQHYFLTYSYLLISFIHTSMHSFTDSLSR